MGSFNGRGKKNIRDRLIEDFAVCSLLDNIENRHPLWEQGIFNNHAYFTFNKHGEHWDEAGPLVSKQFLHSSIGTIPSAG